MNHAKTIGLLALATFALTAFVGTASSSAWTFTAGKTGAKLSETTLTNHRFAVTGSLVECGEVSFSGSTEATETLTQNVAPTYKSCTAFGFGAVVDTTGCKYKLWAWGEVDITSCTSSGIMVTVKNVFATCEVLFPNQTGLTVVTFSNGSGDYQVSFNVDNLYTEVKKSTGLCPLSVGNEYHSTFTGKSTIQGEGTTVSWDF